MVRAMKKGNPLADEDHVVRHVPYQRLARDSNDVVFGILAAALEVRPQDNNQLSVNWLEFYDGAHSDRIADLVRAFRASREAEGSTVGGKSGFAVANVGKVKQIGENADRRLRIVFSPSKGNPSHSLIQPLHADEASLLEALASEAFTELVINSNIPA
jgi:hypothetical protein